MPIKAINIFNKEFKTSLSEVHKRCRDCEFWNKNRLHCPRRKTNKNITVPSNFMACFKFKSLK